MVAKPRRRCTSAIAIACMLAGSALLPIPGLGATIGDESHSTLQLRPAGISSTAPTPVSLTFSERIWRSDGGHVSPLQELTIDLDRRLAIDLRGLPKCHAGDFQVDNPEADPCRSAKIGSGWIEVDVKFPEEGPFPITARLTVYNGQYENGVAKLYLRGYITAPVSGAFVLTAKVHREIDGRFGTRMAISVPRIAGDGAVTNFRFRLRKGIVTATCPGGRLWAAVSARLADSSLLGNLADSGCVSLHKTP